MNDEPAPRSHTALPPPGWRRVHEPSVSSTQDFARVAARRGDGSRWLFTSDFQTQGRGRQGRTWVAPPDSSLILTVLLHNEPLAPVEHTVLAAVTLCETIERMFRLAPRIKWPNDLLIEDRKVAGVLAESSSDAPGYVAIGIGLNTRWGGQRPENIPSWATSLDEHTGHPVEREAMLAQLAQRLHDWLHLLAGAGSGQLWDAWSSRLWRHGETVEIISGDEVLRGRLLGCTRSGALRLSRPEGDVLEIFAGDLALPGERVGRLLGPGAEVP